MDATYLRQELDRVRDLVEELRPQNCCPGAVMQTSDGKSTRLCVDSCKWQELELHVANCLVEIAV